MKRVVFFVDKEKKEMVKKFLDQNGITWSDETRFRFDLRTGIIAFVVGFILACFLV